MGGGSARNCTICIFIEELMTRREPGAEKKWEHVTLGVIISAYSLLCAIVKAVSLRVHSFIMLMPLWGGEWGVRLVAI